MTNVLEAIINISNLEKFEVDKIVLGRNRVISMGEGLENFVKNAFANTFGDISDVDKMKIYSDCFSYEGSKSTPPDLMLKGGDAFEVKKVESLTAELQLNSSHPKAKLFSSSSLINKHCVGCENWYEKDFFYIVGHIPKSKTSILSSLWFIDGSIYAADENVYIGVKRSVSDLLQNSNDLSFSATKEIGRINAVDPLRITNLRIRGMWLLQSPYTAFSYIHGYDRDSSFQTIAILPLEKYNNYPQESRDKIENNKNIGIENIEVKNPNNPVHLLRCKRIIFQLK